MVKHGGGDSAWSNMHAEIHTWHRSLGWSNMAAYNSNAKKIWPKMAAIQTFEVDIYSN